MPHLRIEYSGNLEAAGAMATLCQALADTMAAQQDSEGNSVFPLAGTRVLAYPSAHHAVAGGGAGHGFIYLNLRITPGRPVAIVEAAGEALLATIRAHFDALRIDAKIGITLHIDEGKPVYEGKHRLP